jgi:hypothetical protein
MRSDYGGNMRKSMCITAAVVLLALTSCNGSFIDPGMMDMEGGGGSGNSMGASGGGGGGGSGGGSTWSKLTAGTGIWIGEGDNGSLLQFYDEDGGRWVRISLFYSATVSVNGNTITIDGDNMTIKFNSSTTMTLSNGTDYLRSLEGTYRKAESYYW